MPAQVQYSKQYGTLHLLVLYNNLRTAGPFLFVYPVILYCSSRNRQHGTAQQQDEQRESNSKQKEEERVWCVCERVRTITLTYYE